MTVTLSDEQYKQTCKNTFKLLGKLHKALKERDAYKQQRDELIEDIAKLRERNAELEKKAKAFDEILNCAGGNSMDVGDDVNRIVDEYYEEEQND
ncbi:Uncharacterised protein [Streptococcus pneumoniae]|uniref:hypothetical protein n=1 Tax=Staphylococcus warneri TaxID=1292 RepID=UPI0005E2C952|nr:Uncharacterised protein [Staphylococcus warneri]COQ25711.1 Uncharacterised protein [Streptococcus pneumoniae]